MRIGVSFGIALVLAVFVVEVMSRIADRVLAAEVRDPAFDVRTYKPWFLDGLTRSTLEYGSVKRALEQGQARNVPHPYLGYALKPDYRTRPGATQQASHNSLGFRGKEVTWEKPPGVFRILTTGGSSVYGQSESSDAAVWSQRLEDILNEGAGSKRFEVVNVGCNGWSSFEMLINLELRGLDFSPDLVLTYEAINDMRCALYKPGGPVVRDNLQWRATWPVDRPSRIERLLEHSRTYLVWRRYATNYVAERSDLGFFAITNYRPDDGDLYWNYEQGPVPELGFQNYRRNIENIASLCAARGVRLLFVTQALPSWHLEAKESAHEQRDAFERIQNIEREVGVERGVPVFECAAIMEAAADKELLDKVAELCAADPKLDRGAVEGVLKMVPYPPVNPKMLEALHMVLPNAPRDLLFFSEVHPSDRGSDVIAHTIAGYLLQSDLIPH